MLSIVVSYSTLCIVVQYRTLSVVDIESSNGISYVTVSYVSCEERTINAIVSIQAMIIIIIIHLPCFKDVIR